MSEFAIKLEEARRRLSTGRYMEQCGRAIVGKKCPYCGKTGVSLRSKDGQEWFKCFHVNCPSQTHGKGAAWDQVRFVMHEHGISNRKEATILFMKEAGVWQDREAYAPSVMPGKAPRKLRPPSEQSTVTDEECFELAVPPDDENEPLATAADIEGAPLTAEEFPRTNPLGAVEKGGMVPVEMAGRSNAEAGCSPVEVVEPTGMDWVETPPTTPAPAEVQPAGAVTLPEAATAPVAPATTDEPKPEAPALVLDVQVQGQPDKPKVDCGEDEELIQNCAEFVIAERNGSVGSLQRKFRLGYARGARIMDELEARGIVGPAKDRAPREVLVDGLPKPAPQTNIVNLAGQPVPVPAKPEPVEAHEPDGRRSLNEFFQTVLSRVGLSNADAEMLFRKRGLATSVCRLLGLVSNPKDNLEILEALFAKYGFEDVWAAGLWLEKDARLKKPRRANSQFYGYGIKKKRPKALRVAAQNAGEEDPGAFTWGWTEPVIIPYLDEHGDVIGMRPHKGMGRSGTLTGTPRIYIPRALRALREGTIHARPERFSTVVITEGEHKAQALWQTVGRASRLSDPFGVCALPGIWFVRNPDLREMLDQWLREVYCREVIVVFDSEEKGDPKLESYKPDFRDRYDALKCAKYLAADLYRKLHVRGKVAQLPTEWRNKQGKADWDGALARLVHGETDSHRGDGPSRSGVETRSGKEKEQEEVMA